MINVNDFVKTGLTDFRSREEILSNPQLNCFCVHIIYCFRCCFFINKLKIKYIVMVSIKLVSESFICGILHLVSKIWANIGKI